MIDFKELEMARHKGTFIQDMQNNYCTECCEPTIAVKPFLRRFNNYEYWLYCFCSRHAIRVTEAVMTSGYYSHLFLPIEELSTQDVFTIRLLGE